MSILRSLLATALLVAAAGCSTMTPPTPNDVARAQVQATERAFAATMAARDLAAFGGFIADEAVFFTGPAPLRGKAAVVAHWARYFQGPKAPFSWEPDEVEVLDSGRLALSSGPVHDPSGKLIARFTSTWRLEAPGTWRIVFDRGDTVCASGCR